MILRRMREHVGKHNWFAVGIDLVIVVLGVFIGTQVSNWNSDRLAHAAGETYRSRIVRDIGNNAADLSARSAYYRQLRTFGLQVLSRLDGASQLSDEQFLIAAFQATHIYPRPMARATYDEVLAVGALNTLGDVATRERISNYYVAVETSEITFRSLPPYRDLVRSAIPYAVQERIRAACPEALTNAAGDNGLMVTSLPEHCNLALPPGQLSRAALQLSQTPGLESALTRLLADLDQKLIQTDRSLMRARRLATELARPR